jgi:hypothetical protein
VLSLLEHANQHQSVQPDEIMYGVCFQALRQDRGALLEFHALLLETADARTSDISRNYTDSSEGEGRREPFKIWNSRGVKGYGGYSKEEALTDEQVQELVRKVEKALLRWNIKPNGALARRSSSPTDASLSSSETPNASSSLGSIRLRRLLRAGGAGLTSTTRPGVSQDADAKYGSNGNFTNRRNPQVAPDNRRLRWGRGYQNERPRHRIGSAGGAYRHPIGSTRLPRWFSASQQKALGYADVLQDSSSSSSTMYSRQADASAQSERNGNKMMNDEGRRWDRDFSSGDSGAAVAPRVGGHDGHVANGGNSNDVPHHLKNLRRRSSRASRGGDEEGDGSIASSPTPSFSSPPSPPSRTPISRSPDAETRSTSSSTLFYTTSLSSSSHTTTTLHTSRGPPSSSQATQSSTHSTERSQDPPPHLEGLRRRVPRHLRAPGRDGGQIEIAVEAQDPPP